MLCAPGGESLRPLTNLACTVFLWASAPASSGQDPVGGGEWQALELPGLCLETRARPQLARLLTGEHIDLSPDRLELDDELPIRPSLPVTALLGLLREESRRGRWSLNFSSAAPPLLVQGPADQRQPCSDMLAEIDQAGRAFEVELAAWVTPGSSAAGTHPSREDFEGAVGSSAPWGLVHALSGERVVFGRREHKGFVADYSIEVATDSGVATPIVGNVSFGRVLHVRACRVRRGTALHIEGLLDAAELESIEPFDSESPDLGLFEQPRVASLQVAFSGVVESGAVLALPISGAPLATPDFTLWIRASTRADPEATRWRCMDVSLLETRMRALPLLKPGAGLALDTTDSRPTWLNAVPSSLIAQIADAAAPSSGTRPRVVWSPGFLMAPADATEAWRSIDSLVGAAEAGRLRSAELSIRHGPLSLLVPTTEGVSLRLRAGREYCLLESYDAEIAPESWMPAPNVAWAFDGLALHALLSGSRVGCDAWIAQSERVVHLTRKQIALAGLQLAQRAFDSASTQLSAGDPAREILNRDGASGLRLQLALP